MSFYLRVKSHMCVASGLHMGHTGQGAQRAHSKLPSGRPRDGARDPAQHHRGQSEGSSCRERGNRTLRSGGRGKGSRLGMAGPRAHLTAGGHSCLSFLAGSAVSEHILLG